MAELEVNESSENMAQLGECSAGTDLVVHPSYQAGRIDDEVLVELLVRRGQTQRSAAEFFGVTEAAVSKRKKKLDLAVNTQVALFSAPMVLNAHLTQSENLSVLSRQVQDLIDLVQLVVHGDQTQRSVIEARQKLRRLAGRKGDIGSLAVKLFSELRKQLEFIFTQQREIYSLKRVEEFQSVVLDEIGKASPELRKRVVQRLMEVQAARSSLDFENGGFGGLGG